MDDLMMNHELDQLETLGRKEGILYLRKGYRSKRDLLSSLLTSLDRTVVLITVGRKISKVEEMQHENLRSLIRVKGNEANGLLNWSDDLETFRYVASSLEKAIELSGELAIRGDIVLFSPCGSEDEIIDWYKLFDKRIKKIGL